MNVSVVQNNLPLMTINHNGQVYALVEHLGPYVLRVSNPRNSRAEVVLSVDGLSILTGEKASTTERGYVLSGYETADIPGWRRSNSEVAKFEFTEKAMSYAQKTGRGQNTSVIGAAWYDEVAPAFSWHAAQASITRGKGRGGMFTSSVIGTKGASYRTEVGTGYGGRADFHVGSTSFNRSTQTPVLVQTIRYGTREMLTSWGVPLPSSSNPNPFPGDGCPAPAGWRG